VDADQFGSKVQQSLGPRVDRQRGSTLFSSYWNRSGSTSARSPGDLLYFQDIVDRTQHAYLRYPIYQTADRKEGETRNKPDATSATLDEGSLRIVCIGPNLELWNDPRKLKLTAVRDACRILQPTDGKFESDHWMKDRLFELEQALKLRPRPDVIIFPEYAYPPPEEPEAESWMQTSFAKALKRREEFEAKALKLVGKRDVFLVLGSFHCPITLYNIAVIYPWGAKRFGQGEMHPQERQKGGGGLTFIAPKDTVDLIEAPVLYRKRFPARKVGERVRVPTGLDFNFFRKSFGGAAVMICSDVTDANQTLFVARENIRELQNPQPGSAPFQFVFIPAYNPAHQFEDFCRDFSSLAATTVVVANVEDSHEFPKSDLYLFGQDTKARANSAFKDVVKTKTVKLQNTNLHVFDVDLGLMRWAQGEHVKELDPSGEFAKATK